MFFVILLLNICLQGSEYKWEKFIHKDSINKGVNTLRFITDGDYYYNYWTISEYDPEFFNILSKKRKGISYSSDKGKTWNIIMEDLWEIDKDNPIESSKYANDSLKSFSLPNILPNDNFIVQYEQGFLLKTSDFGKSWDTTHLGTKDDNGQPKIINASKNYTIDFNENYNFGIFRSTIGYNIFSFKMYYTEDTAKTWKEFDFKYENFDTGIPKESFELTDIKIIDENQLLFRIIDNRSKLYNGYREFHISQKGEEKYKRIFIPESDFEFHHDLRIVDSIYFLDGFYEFHPEYNNETFYIYRSSNKGDTWNKVYNSIWHPTLTQNYIKLDNNDIICTSSYKILRSTDNGFSWKLDEIDKIDSLDKVFAYTMWVDKKNGQVIVSSNNDYYYVMTKTSSVEINSMNHYFNVYPNPINNNEKIQFDFVDDYPVSIDIIDLKGNILNNFKLSEIQNGITLNNLSQGVYFIKAKYKDQSVLKKLVIE